MGRDGRGAVITIVNPGQCVAAIPLPHVSSAGETLQDGRILFTDAGRSPELGAGMVKLGPEQLCVIGYGAYADSGCDLGLEKDVVIPTSIEPIPATFEDRGANRIRAEITPPESGDTRIIMTQHHRGMAYRSSGGAPPGGQSLGHILRIAARQGGRVVPIHVEYDKMIWSGLSWAAGEIRRADIQSGQSLVITCSSGEDRLLDLDGRIYRVTAA